MFGWLIRLSWRARVRIVLFVFPVLTLLAACLFAIEALVFIARSDRVTGTVVQRYDWPGETIFDRGSVNYEPVFTYRVNNETRRASVGSAHASFKLDVGQTAVIRAVPASRGNVRLDTWQGLWFVPVILAALGLAAGVIAAALWWVARRYFFRKELG